MSKKAQTPPKNFEDAMASPFWHRLLIAPDRKSSNVLVFVEEQDSGKIINGLERIIRNRSLAGELLGSGGNQQAIHYISRGQRIANRSRLTYSSVALDTP